MHPFPEKPEPDLSGRQLGDYQILKRLGRGGMADVYLAEQRSLRRQVAFKVLHARLANDENYVRRFHHEAQTVAALIHPNIVQIYEVGCLEGIHFIAQEYVAGHNLLQVLSRRGVLDAAAAVDVLRQVAAALHKAGERGIIHRDIKPENILLSSAGEIKVADFGLARINQPAAGGPSTLGLTQIGMTMGTPLYMSPEQAEGREIDQRSDLYSLGVSCYQMLAGRPPFQGDTALSIAVQHLNKQPDRLETLREDLPPALCQTVHKMLAKKPRDRHQNAAELLRELRELHLDGGDASWPADGGLSDLGRTQPLAHELTAATQALQASMLLAAQRVRPRRPCVWIVACSLLAFVAGGAGAWMTRPKSLLAGGETVTIEQLDSAAEQFDYAMRVGTEAAFQSVIDYFQNDGHPTSESSVNKAKLQLAYIYYGEDRIDEAMRLFSELAQQENDYQQQAMGLIWQANIHAQRDQLSAANQKVYALAEVINRAGTNSLRQRQILQQEALNTLDPRLQANLRQHLQREVAN